MNKSDSLKKSAKMAVGMSDHFVRTFCIAILIIDLAVGAIMMTLFGKSLTNAFCVAIIITIGVPLAISTFYAMFISPSRDDII